MKSSYHFIFSIILFCSLSLNPQAKNVSSHHLIKVTVEVFKDLLEKTTEVVQNVTSTMSHMHVGNDDRNADVAISYCEDLLGSTAQVLNWPLSTIHNLKDDLISHTRTWLNNSLSRHKTCVEAFDGPNSIVARSLKQVTRSILDLLAMLQDVDDVSRWSHRCTYPWMQTPNITVSKDGREDFELISDAIAAAPNHSQGHFVILVLQGVYYEHVNIGPEKSNIILVGEGTGYTTISGNRSNGSGWSTSNSATFIVKSDGFIAVDISFENTAGPKNKYAVAVWSAGDRIAFYRCSISGHQNTLLVHSGRQFFGWSKIIGTVDFIFGYATAVFQSCTIVSKRDTESEKNVLTTHGRFTQNDTSGFSFQFCNITYDNSLGDDNMTPTYLGQPWGNYSRTVFMQSYLSKVIRPEGWLEWNRNFGLNTLFFGEYENEGPGSELSGRVKWPGYHVIDHTDAADEFTVAIFINGNSWLPSTGVTYSSGQVPTNQ